MLPKSRRLNLKKNFKWVVSGKKTESLSMKFFYRSGLNKNPLVGIAVTKHSTKKAHERNFIKRLIYRAVEEIYPDLPNNLNLVIMPKGGAVKKSEQELINELKNVKNFN